jgi:hypothetical protein
MFMMVMSLSLAHRRFVATFTGALAAALLVAAECPVYGQSLSYSKGQNVSPAYEGWEEEASGARYFLFGYMNRNWEEEIEVPIGPDNTFSLGAADQGQPTHFLPRRNRFVFRVPVPAGFTEKDELVWTLTTRGKTEKAYATIRTDYKVDDVVKASETGALGAGTSSPEVRANKAPTVSIHKGEALTVKVGQPLTLTAVVSDDGTPKPRAAGLVGSAVSNPGSTRDRVDRPENSRNPVRVNRAMQPPFRSTVGKNVGLHVSWFVYRGAGPVTFDPEQVAAWEDTRTGANSPWAPIWVAPELPSDGRIPVHVTFTEPGTYRLRARADDGALMADDDVTVTVTR